MKLKTKLTLLMSTALATVALACTQTNIMHVHADDNFDDDIDISKLDPGSNEALEYDYAHSVSGSIQYDSAGNGQTVIALSPAQIEKLGKNNVQQIYDDYNRHVYISKYEYNLIRKNLPDAMAGNIFGINHQLPTTEYFAKTSDWFTLSPEQGIKSKNSLSIKWYKTPKVRTCWPNRDFIAANGDGPNTTTFPTSSDQNTWNTASFRGKTIIVGSATFNGMKFDIAYSGKQCQLDKIRPMEFTYTYANKKPKNMRISLISKEYYASPQLMKTNHSICLYTQDVREDSTWISAVMVTSYKQARFKSGAIFMLPTHHQPVELAGIKFVPVVYPDSRLLEESGLIKYSDFKKYVTNAGNAKMAFDYQIAAQKNGHVSFQLNSKQNKKELDTTVGWVKSYMKSSKQKKAAEQQLLTLINKRYKTYKKYGLTTR